MSSRIVRELWLIGDNKPSSTRTVASYGTVAANSTLETVPVKISHAEAFSLLVFCGMVAGTPAYSIDAAPVAIEKGTDVTGLLDEEYGAYSAGFSQLVTTYTNATNKIWSLHGISLPVSGWWKFKLTNNDAVNAATAHLANNTGIRMALRLWG